MNLVGGNPVNYCCVQQLIYFLNVEYLEDDVLKFSNLLCNSSLAGGCC